MKTNVEIKALIAQMTTEEKASLCSGFNFWTTKSVDRLGIPSIMLTDGPHGLRKQSGTSDHLGLNSSVPATCFPPACTTACSFDRDLLFEVGSAIGEECLQEDVAVVLGPGANIKRSPLCGRNFEYFSEDPVLAGESVAALISGVQSNGVGTSLKHFAANNQEKSRLTTSSVVDKRALHEIYLKNFEIAVKKGNPDTVMCAYNQLNGIYCCENEELLTDILRRDWGFDGVVVTDWGAMDDRIDALKAGLELEMPASGGVTDTQIVEAIAAGTLDEKVLDTAVERLLNLTFKTAKNMNTGYRYNQEAHHAIAKKAALESAVLLKNNDSLLPAKKEAKIAVIGEFAKTPRYQGAGSSKINPHQVDSLFDSFTAQHVAFDFSSGYHLDNHAPDDALIASACEIAKGKEVVIIAAGLPDEYESEGFDRTSLDMPASHNKLIEHVAKVNPNIAVVLMAGSAVSMPWLGAVKSVLLCSLTGEAGGGAIADLLLGSANPCGKLAESYPLSLTDTPCFANFAGDRKTVEYRESIFVGYRYYDTAKKPLLFSFGHGLSYTDFAYSDVVASADACDNVTVSLSLTNTGAAQGAEIVQLYVGKKDSAILRAQKELKDFAKVTLNPGETKTVCFALKKSAFAFYSADANAFLVESGTYELLIGASSADIRLCASVALRGDALPSTDDSAYRSAYEEFANGNAGAISDDAFTALYGRALPPSRRMEGEPFTLNSTLGDMADTQMGQMLLAQAKAQMAAQFGEGANDIKLMMESMMQDMPLRSMGILSGSESNRNQLTDILAAANAELKI